MGQLPGYAVAPVKPGPAMRFLKRLAVGLVLLIAAFAVVVWLQPDDYRLTRSTVIAAPAANVFAQANDLSRWDNWSPWAKLDPNAKITFSGPKDGVGAPFKGDGNDKAGAGTMTIIESRPNERVATRTDFVKPFEGTSRTDFIFSRAGDQTNVIWTMSGTHGFVSKAICLVMSMENMLGPDVERGLVQLKQAAEAKNPTPPPPPLAARPARRSRPAPSPGSPLPDRAARRREPTRW